MKIFFSWSGERSRRVAELFNDTLPLIIQACQPWFSPHHIESGEVWDDAIQNQLSNTHMGIVFLTDENKEKPWIPYESGALNKGLTKNRVFTILIDITPDHLLKNPLSKFNHTDANDKESLSKLFHAINNNLVESTGLKAEVLDKVLARFLEDLRLDIQKAVSETKERATVEKPKTEDLLSEILAVTRNLDDKIDNLRLDQEPDPYPRPITDMPNRRLFKYSRYDNVPITDASGNMLYYLNPITGQKYNLATHLTFDDLHSHNPGTIENQTARGGESKSE